MALGNSFLEQAITHMLKYDDGTAQVLVQLLVTAFDCLDLGLDHLFDLGADDALALLCGE